MNKIKKIVRKIMRLDKEEVKSSDTDNMYDFFTKKTIDRFLDKKHIERLDKDYIDWNKKIDLPDYVKNNPNIDYWNISGPHTEFNKKFIIPIGKKKITNMEAGIVYLPYIMQEHTVESFREYNEFMDGYKKKHKYCPECGGTSYSTTLVGYILNMDKQDEYKDENTCTCSVCGNRHTEHERVETKKED